MKSFLTKEQWRIIAFLCATVSLFWLAEFTGNCLEAWPQGIGWDESRDPYSPTDYGLSIIVTFLLGTLSLAFAAFPNMTE